VLIVLEYKLWGAAIGAALTPSYEALVR